MTVTIDGTAVINSVLLTEQGSAPATPSAGLQKLYATSNGLRRINSSGDSVPVMFVPEPGGRLTLTSGTPVTSAFVTGATSIWYQPYLHDQLPLWDGSDFIPVTFTSTPISLAGLSGSSVIDIFTYLNGSVPAYETSMWTSPTDRAINLIYQNGRLVKSGDPTRLYLGSAYINSSGGRTDDGGVARNLWNYYNRVPRQFYRSVTETITYNGTAIRYWNNNPIHFVEFLVGVVEDPAFMTLRCQMDSNSTQYTRLGMDIDAATAYDLTLPYNEQISQNYNAYFHSGNATFYPTLGRHFYSIIQNTGASHSYYSYLLTGWVLG